MKKFSRKTQYALNVLRRKALDLYFDQSGFHTHTDNVSLIAAGIFTVATILAIGIPWLKTTYMPKAGGSILGFFG